MLKKHAKDQHLILSIKQTYKKSATITASQINHRSQPLVYRRTTCHLAGGRRLLFSCRKKIEDFFPQARNQF